MTSIRFIKVLKAALLFATLFLFSPIGNAQSYIQGSVMKDAAPNTVDIQFKANYNSDPGEYVLYLQFCLAIPESQTNGHAVVATATAFGTFSNIVFTQDTQYTRGTERIFTWVFANPTLAIQSWAANTQFTGVKVKFTGGTDHAQSTVKMLDLTNEGGGTNLNTFFAITTSSGDRTNYSNLFYAILGISTLGNDVTSGDQYVQTINFVALPTSLLEFTGTKDGSRNQLRWSTGSELNSKGFEIQRSVDLVHFEPVGYMNSIAPGGNSGSRLNYSFVDNYPPGLLQYYRLRMEDRNGVSRYSNIISIRRDKPVILSIDALYPNPAQVKINLQINSPAAGPLNLRVTDLLGRILFTRQVTAASGYNLVPVDVSNLPAGTYWLRVSGDAGDVQKKFIKE